MSLSDDSYTLYNDANDWLYRFDDDRGNVKAGPYNLVR